MRRAAIAVAILLAYLTGYAWGWEDGTTYEPAGDTNL